jgi:glycine/D-amino acid oxidase-like deaminating enzyme
MKAEMDQADLDARLQAMIQLGVDAEMLDPEGLRTRFPSLRFAEENAVATWEPGSGYVYPSTGAVEDLRAAGEAEGVVYRVSTPLLSGNSTWFGNARAVQSVSVDSPDGTRTLDCDVVVNCAGPDSHAVNLAMDCPLPLTTAPQRQFIIEGTWENPDGLVVPAMADLVNGFYMRPDRRQFKVGAVLPMDHVDFTQDPEASGWQERAHEFEERLLNGLAQRVPGVELKDVETKVAYYDWTVSDSYPLLGATDVQGYYVAIGTSGAWFKAGPVIGELMAALVDRRQSGDLGTVFRLSRTGNDLDLSHFSVRR